MSLDFLYTAVSWVLLRWHSLFTAIGLKRDGGLNWALSIVFLVVTARLLLFRVFVKQVHSQRRMQEMQPKMNAIKAKYKDDRQAQQREMMKLQQEEGFNPISGCLPMVLQIPIFIGLFHSLRHISNSAPLAEKYLTDPNSLTKSQLHSLTLYTFSKTETVSAARANFFGAPLAGRLTDSATKIEQLGGHIGVTRIVMIILMIVSAVATFITQRVVMRNATTVAVGSAATIQRLMLYFIPLSVLVSGLFFPLGVLLYWFTSNLWTMGQQFYILRYHPHESTVVAAAGEVGKTLAPRPGAKPSLDKRRPTTVDESGDDGPRAGGSNGSAGSSSVATPAKPRPGSRPTRPGTNRPAGKRPANAKAKKRR